MSIPRRMVLPNGEVYVPVVSRVTERDEPDGQGNRRPRELSLLYDNEVAELSGDPNNPDKFMILFACEKTLKGQP